MTAIEIALAENGYILKCEDDAIAEANSKEGARWKDPQMSRVYTTSAALLKDLAALLPKMKRPEPKTDGEDTSSFNEVFKSE